MPRTSSDPTSQHRSLSLTNISVTSTSTETRSTKHQLQTRYRSLPPIDNSITTKPYLRTKRQISVRYSHITSNPIPRMTTVNRNHHYKVRVNHSTIRCSTINIIQSQSHVTANPQLLGQQNHLPHALHVSTSSTLLTKYTVSRSPLVRKQSNTQYAKPSRIYQAHNGRRGSHVKHRNQRRSRPKQFKVRKSVHPSHRRH